MSELIQDEHERFRDSKIDSETKASEIDPIYKFRDCRLYFKRTGENSFRMVAFRWCLSDVEVSRNTGDPWIDEDAYVDQIFEATAYFDGVRHLEFNRDSDSPGYVYYPNIEFISQAFNILRQKEVEICRDCD